MTSPFHGAALQQLRSKVLAPGATTGHALVAVLGAGTLERGLGQSLERGLPWSIIWVLGEWDIYIYIRLIIWGSSILPVIWGGVREFGLLINGGGLWENYGRIFRIMVLVMELWNGDELIVYCLVVSTYTLKTMKTSWGYYSEISGKKKCPKPPTSL